MAKRKRAKAGNAERQRRYRERAAAGLVRIEFVTDEVALTELLIATGRLAPELADNRRAICMAVKAVIESLGVGFIHNSP